MLNTLSKADSNELFIAYELTNCRQQENKVQWMLMENECRFFGSSLKDKKFFLLVI